MAVATTNIRVHTKITQNNSYYRNNGCIRNYNNQTSYTSRGRGIMEITIIIEIQIILIAQKTIGLY